MAEPESAVLPITPYPIGCLKQLVRGFSAVDTRSCGAAASRPRADVQTTKQSGRRSPVAATYRDRHRASAFASPDGISLVSGQPAHATPAEDGHDRRFGYEFGLRTTGLVNVPIPLIVMLTVSPSSMGPTPAGVPVRMRSPGSNVMTAETHSTIAPTS
jgi:hypothetical protein